MRVFLDANILFSAAKSAGAVRGLLIRARASGLELCADAYVVEEARRNLLLKESGAVDCLAEILATIEVGRFHPAPLPARIAALVPSNDRPVLAAAVRMGCQVLLTGDRTHFGPLYGKEVLGVVVHSPRSLAEWRQL